MGEAEFEKKSRSRFMTHTDDSLWLNCEVNFGQKWGKNLKKGKNFI